MTETTHDTPGGPVRVRYAPSPTGDPHVGNLRTAILNWIFARSTGGQFLVRIEDTDQERKTPGAQERIMEALEWLGLDWDEGPGVGGPHSPYIQSERADLYRAAARELIDNGHAYECFCTPERLDAVRQRQRAEHRPTGYDGYCRNKSESEREEDRASGQKPVVRFKMPLEGRVNVRDYLRGQLSFEAHLLDDFVILKSDGFPTYHLAHLVDDHYMDISHVLRSEEWISSTPRHVLMYQAFGWTPPHFVHLSILLGPDRTKLSKRHGATGLLDYRDMGYLPEAMFNFLALLGWSPRDDTEVMSRDEIVRRFRPEDLNASPSIFDVEKLDWMNGVYLRQMDHEGLTDLLMPELEKGLPPDVPRPIDRDFVRKLAPLIQERMRSPSEAPEMTTYFFEEDVDLDVSQVIQKGMDEASTAHALRRSVEAMREAEAFHPDPLEQRFRELCDELELKPRQLFGALRVALTGRKVAPPLFDTMSCIGRERCIRRLEHAVERLSSAQPAGD
ncbi:MAG: glutamate--tRNA ligase [Chloroflexota bacterium]